jgi:anti-sigma factor RsiW
MNPNDPRLKLITAGLDGELPLLARRRLKRLLRSDAEAIAMFVALRNDKKMLAGFSNPVLPVDFSRTVGLVLAQAKPQRVEISRAQKSPVRTRFVTWNKALALSIIWLVGLAFLAYWIIPVRGPLVELDSRIANATPRFDGSESVQAVQGLAPELETSEFPRVVANGAAPDVWSNWLMPEQETRAASIFPAEKAPQVEASGQSVDGNTAVPVLGAPAVRRNNLEELSLLLPASLSWNELSAVPKTMDAVIGQSGPVQIDLPSADPNRAVELLLGVLKESRRSVMVDGLAMDRVKRGNIRAHFMVLVEDVSSSQLGSILESLRKANEKQGFGKSGQFGPSLIVSSPDAMRKNLRAMVGQDLLAETFVRTSKSVIPRDLEGETAKQALQAVEGGRPSRPSTATTPTVLPTVLVLAYSPYYPAVKSQPQSAEVRKYLESRASGKPGAGRALLVFRGWSQ